MKKITNYEEFMTLWNIDHKNRYWGNKKISIEQEQDIIERANITDFKRYNIYMLQDNKYIVIDTKWAIDNKLYYDDETPTPNITLKYFKAKNKTNISYYKIENIKECNKPFIIKTYYNEQSNQVSIVNRENISDYESQLNWAKSKNHFIRYLTDEEIKEYNIIVDELQKEYDKRLENYFKKYNKNIKAIGYWVNR